MSMTPRDERRPEPRASDADRDRAATVLREGATAGKLTLDELAQRLDLVYAATTLAELELVTADLETLTAATQPRAASEDDVHLRRRILRRKRHEFVVHATSYGSVNGFLVGVWAMTGADYFWPMWPLMGWGIGLVIHGVNAALGTDVDEEVERQKRRARRKVRDVPCPSCGDAMRPAGGVFVCGTCGRTIAANVIAPVERPAPEPASIASGRHLAVMFTDIVDSTRLNDVMGDEAWARVRARHAELVRAAIGEHDGRELSNPGDGFVASFDDAQDAAACAIAIQRGLEHGREESGFAPSVRIGLHAGQAVESSGDIVGQTLNLAARVMGEASADEIWLTEPAADLLGGRHRLRDRGLRTLKGFSTPRHLLELDWRA